MRRLVWSSASACALALVAACTTFGTDDPKVAPDGGGDTATAPLPDAAAEAGGGDAAVDAEAGRPPCAGEADCERYVFVTTELYAGEDMGAAIGADGRCNAYASRAGTLPKLVGRSFLAWVSDDVANFTVSARHTHGTKPYRLADETLIANDWTQLTSGSIQHAINLTERGATIGQELVWTGTTALGEVASKTCTNWSISGADNAGTVGRANVTDSTWTNSGVSMCGISHRLYCVEK